MFAGGISKAGGNQSERERFLIFMWNRLNASHILFPEMLFLTCKRWHVLSGTDHSLEVFVYICFL